MVRLPVVRRGMVLACIVVAALLVQPLLANSSKIPNWVVGARGDYGNGTYFQAVDPCRVVDTRRPIGMFGGPSFSAGETRLYYIPDGPCAGIPEAGAYSLNFTVVDNPGGGYLTAWQYGYPQPFVSTMNFATGGAAIANAAVVPANAGSINVYVSGAVNVVIDINGYFTNYPPANRSFWVSGDHPGGAIVEGDNSSSTNGSAGVLGWAGSGSGAVFGVYGQSNGSSGSAGVYGFQSTTTTGVFGVMGKTGTSISAAWPFTGNTGVGGIGFNGVAGVGTYAGVAGSYVSGGSVGAKAFLGWTIDYSFHANGNAEVMGTLTKGGGSFKIDHPLDPENKYLYHSFVESPDMMNIYNGVTELDASGEAVVLLPDWFEALNRDFRYQLTAMGKPQPNLYIADKIAGNQFRIAGGRPFAEVSWQVTGIRHDAFANAHRIPVEEAKFPEERGTYLHPLEHNQPREKGYEALVERPGVKEVLSEREAERSAEQLKAAQNQ